MLLMLGILLTTGCQKKDESKNIKSDSQTEERNLNYSKMTENELEVASYDGDGDAALELGRRYDFGIDVKTNFQEAMSWYQVAYDNGNKMSSVYLGYLYLNGLGTDKDVNKAIEYFDKAISNNEIEGYSGLARVYLENKDIENAPSLCYNNAKKAYDEKSPMGTFLMAYLTETGYGTQTNIVGAKELYKKLADSNFNNLKIYDSYPYCPAIESCRLLENITFGLIVVFFEPLHLLLVLHGIRIRLSAIGTELVFDIKIVAAMLTFHPCSSVLSSPSPQRESAISINSSYFPQSQTS